MTWKILDCTLRDGGYHNAWDFSVALTDEYLAAMAALGADRVELGFRSLRRDGRVSRSRATRRTNGREVTLGSLRPCAIPRAFSISQRI